MNVLIVNSFYQINKSRKVVAVAVLEMSSAEGAEWIAFVLSCFLYQKIAVESIRFSKLQSLKIIAEQVFRNNYLAK